MGCQLAQMLLQRFDFFLEIPGHQLTIALTVRRAYPS
jgi:hypothetical protein